METIDTTHVTDEPHARVGAWRADATAIVARAGPTRGDGVDAVAHACTGAAPGVPGSVSADA